MLDAQIEEAIYAIVTRDDAMMEMLDALAAAFGCPSAALVYFDFQRNGAGVQLTYGLFDEAARRRYVEEYAALDPAPAAMAALALGEAAATDRLFPPEERQHSRFLNEFYAPLGLREALGAPIAKSATRSGIVAVQRGPDRPSFTDAEIARFAALSLHVARAMELRQRFFATNQEAEMRADALDTLSAPVLIVSEGAFLDFANAAARELLATGKGLHLSRAGELMATDRAAHTELRGALDPLGAGESLVIVPRPDQPAYALRITRRADAHFQASWIIRIAAARGAIAEADKALADALSISRPSARLLLGLLAGHDLQSYALTAGISPNTAKFHLNTGFRATGTNRQSMLLSRVVTILLDLGLW